MSAPAPRTDTPPPGGPPGAPSAAADWLAGALDAVGTDPSALSTAFATAGRHVGRHPLDPEGDPRGVLGSVDDAARALLLERAVHVAGDGAPDLLASLYRTGDTAERRGVLRGLDRLVEVSAPLADALVATGLELVADALRTNDPTLVAAATGPFAAAHLDQHTWRHAVLKLVFMGVTLDAVAGLAVRADDELAAMADRFAAERRAAGRTVPDDLARITPDAGTTTENDSSPEKDA
ncbi:EboA domain-containing protein [Sanguibacter suaedae]|uniref:EboA domain-containing protein n=1 Tax=Sanguibacter suaedae TaxID=2795737 RepID=A0A934MAG4_9MICO|nr:EboA domain-containing protein [Sanguibacter suaedae]MBI9115585.1 EboA domain-containing protein [Sanguibacter suaedae]